MPRATTVAPTFTSAQHLLSGGSSVFNLRLCMHEGIWIDVAEMPSESTAQQCSDILTRVLHRFLACGSDREALSLAVKLEDVLTNY